MINVRTIAQTADTVTLGWDPVQWAGYRFTVDGKVSHTWDPLFRRDKTLPACNTRVSRAAEQVLVEALAVKDSGVWPSAVPPAADTRHVTYFKLGAGELPGSHIPDYQALVVAQGGIDAAVATGQTALFYTSPQVTPDGAYSLSTAQAGPWLLKNTAGRVLNTSFGQPLLDPGSAGARAAFTDEILRRINAYRADGIFHDDLQIIWSGFGGDFGSNVPVNQTTGQPYTQAQWQQACAGWCQHVGAALKPFGKLFAANARGFISGDGRSDTGELTKVFWTAIGGQAVTHFCIEYWVYTPQGTQRLVGPAWNQNWDGWQSLVAHTHSLGARILTLEDASGQTVPVYSRASALLDYEPGDLFVWAQGTDPWRAEYTKNLGARAGGKTRSGDVWRATFERGSVEVNPVAGTARIL